jgi:hypothetical protein
METVVEVHGLEQGTQWYSARVLIECTVDADSDPLVDEQIVLFRATSDDEAEIAARAYGVAQEHEYLNELGDTVRWSLREIQDLAPVVMGPIASGWEVSSRLLRVSELPVIAE